MDCTTVQGPCFPENLCTISWLTPCHLPVRRRNRAQGSESLTARSLRRNAREPGGTCVFNRIWPEKDLSFPSALFGWLLEAIKNNFSPPLTCNHNYPRHALTGLSAPAGGELHFQIVIHFKEWLANVMQEHLCTFTYHSLHVCTCRCMYIGWWLMRPFGISFTCFSFICRSCIMSNKSEMESSFV